MTVRVRFAPSPTGIPHVGNIRTALFNWLFARHEGGKFVLRIEDTDQTRLDPHALEAILESLRWLGLDWDEGPEIGGPYGPYFQSERLEHYRLAAEELIAKDSAYRCYCSPERLEQVRAEQMRRKEPPRYDRRCRNLSEAECKEEESKGIVPVVRFKTPLSGKTGFDDIVRGHVAFENETLDDFVLLKSDGYPTYHLANVVDDHLMEISHVLRAEEWLPSTPRHLLLYSALGYAPPLFAHLPMILGRDRAKLSKRHGAVSLLEYKRQGYLPEAMFNFLGLLGWSLDDHTEIISREEFVRNFSLERIVKNPAIFDVQKLEWMNGVYMRKKPEEDLVEVIQDQINEEGRKEEEEIDRLIPDGAQDEIENMAKAAGAERVRDATREYERLLKDFLKNQALLLDGPRKARVERTIDHWDTYLTQARFNAIAASLPQVKSMIEESVRQARRWIREYAKPPDPRLAYRKVEEHERVIKDFLKNYPSLLDASRKEQIEKTLDQWNQRLDKADFASISASIPALTLTINDGVKKNRLAEAYLGPSKETGGLAAEQIDRLLKSLDASSEEAQRAARTQMNDIASVIKDRVKRESDIVLATGFFFVEGPPDYDPKDLLGKRFAGKPEEARKVLEAARERLSAVEPWEDQGLADTLRPLAEELNLKNRRPFYADTGCCDRADRDAPTVRDYENPWSRTFAIPHRRRHSPPRLIRLRAAASHGKLAPQLGSRLVVGQRTLDPYAGVRILPPQPEWAPIV